jgi:2-polyprenyl-3-methyl-5-hydroxy-6-metoxy-1,4-benzoquinol methylase
VAEEQQTWHYGLVAKWWAEFNHDGPEIAYFQQHVEAGQPALDVACGTGRLLIPYLRAGLDVDGCDVSADMIALCREHAEREG